MTEEKQKQITALCNYFLKERMMDKTIGELCLYDLLEIVQCINKVREDTRHVRYIPIEKMR